MFNLHDFIYKGLTEAIGRLADYQVILNASGWYEKGVLSADDLAEINTKIEAKNTPAVVYDTESVILPADENVIVDDETLDDTDIQ